jgi:hypothetical protein
MTAVLAAPMTTLADIRRRAVPGARLLVAEQTSRPHLVGTIRIVVPVHADPGCCWHPARGCWHWDTGWPDNPGYLDDGIYCSPWPHPMAVHVIDPDTFEYVLDPHERGNIIRLRFLPPTERTSL